MTALAGVFFACLPELSALKTTSAGDAGDAGEEAAATTSACGDGFIDDDAGEKCDPGESVTTTCTSCLVQCAGSIDEQSGHCYYVANAAATYQEAKNACTATGGHLVTLDSEREAAFVDKLAASRHWVGLTRQTSIGGYAAEVTTEPGFPIDGGCPGCYLRALSTTDGGADCVVSADGGWELSACTEIAATICEREPLGQRSFYCQGPYCSTVTFTVGAKRYLLYLDNAARTAGEAVSECAQYDEGKLVVFESAEEREQIVQEVLRLLVDQTSFTAWVGISHDAGAWSWEDGIAVEDGGRPSPWGANQPGTTNAGHAFIRIGPAFFDSQLAQTGEDIARPFICQRK